MNLNLARQEEFGGTLVNFYRGNKDVWMTREQLGEALEYSEPNKAIAKIHERNSDRLDKFSVVVKLTSTDGKDYDTYVYSRKGIMEACRFSRQPKADAFIDWAWEIIDKLMEEGYASLQPMSMEDLIIMQATNMKEMRLHLEKQEQEMKQLKQVTQKTEEKVVNMTDYLTSVPDRAKLETALKRLAREKFNRDYGKTCGEVYKILKMQYGFDTMERVKNKKNKINEEREENNLKRYSDSTLKQKVSGLSIIEEHNMMNETMEIVAGLMGK